MKNKLKINEKPGKIYVKNIIQNRLKFFDV